MSLILTSQYGISMQKKKLLQQKDIMVNITKDEWRLSLLLYCISGSTNWCSSTTFSNSKILL